MGDLKGYWPGATATNLAGSAESDTTANWDDRAFRWQLLLQHRDSVVAAVSHQCLGPSEAEDCVHDAFLQVVQRDDVDPLRVGGLLRTVAMRRAIDNTRERARHQRAICRLGSEAPAASADELALDRWEADQLMAVARNLPQGQRRALAGRVAGFAPRETASAYGVPVKTVHLALCRARTTLKAVAAVAIGVLTSLRRRGAVGAPHAAPGVALLVSGAVMLLLHLGQPQQLPRSDLSGATHSNNSWARPAPGPSTVGTAAMSGALSNQRASSTVPRGGRYPEAAAPDQQLHASLGTPALVGTDVAIKRTHSNQSFIGSVEACLTPGGISLDPHHAGCNSAS